MKKNTSVVFDGGTPGYPLDSRDFIIILTTLAAALLLRLVFFRGVLSIDDFNYLRHAAEIWKGRFSFEGLLYLHGTRPLIFVPVSWLYSLAGPSEAASAAWPLAASLSTVTLYYLIGRSLFGRECAGYTAAFAAILPLAVNESTRILPGAIMNLVIAASVYAFIISESSHRRRLYMIISGAFYGVMPLTGELGMLMGCFFPLAIMLIGHRRLWSYWPAAAGFTAVVLMQVLYQWIVTGDPMFKAHVSKLILTNEVPPLRPFYYINILVRPFVAHGGIFYLAAAGAFAAVRSRSRGALFVLAWLIVMWALIEYMSSSLTSYRPLYKYVRYASILALPAVLLSAFGLKYIRLWIENAAAGTGGSGRFEGKLWIFRRRAGSIAAASILIVLALASIHTLQKTGAWAVERRGQLQQLRSRVAAFSGKTIYVTHWLWNTRVGYQTGYADEYFPSGYDPYHAVSLISADRTSKNRYVQTLTPGEEMSAGLLINDETLLAVSLSERGSNLVGSGEIPEFLAAPPPEWKLLERLKVGGNTLALYEIPEGAHRPKDI